MTSAMCPRDYNIGLPRSANGPSSRCTTPFLLQPLRQKDLEKGLIGHVPLICQDLEIFNHMCRKAQRDSSERRLQVRELTEGGSPPVDVLHRIVSGPEFALLVLRSKLRHRFL